MEKTTMVDEKKLLLRKVATGITVASVVAGMLIGNDKPLIGNLTKGDIKDIEDVRLLLKENPQVKEEIYKLLQM